jgi:4-amino-4-deoxy-L-arabinose transferase-like glycosyltransferase
MKPERAAETTRGERPVPHAERARPGHAFAPANGAAPRVWAAAWPGAVLVLALLVPFLGKAHAIDDVTFLLQAQHVLHDPLHPTAFNMVADGERIRLSSMLVSGPVMAYLLVPSLLLGGAEWAAHLVQLLLMLVAVFATVAIGLRLGLRSAEARLAGLLLASTPAAAAMATTSMADVPAMAFGVFGMERLLCWRDEGRLDQGIAAALAFALAFLARPQLLVIVAIAVLALWGGARAARFARAAWQVWLPLLLAVAVFTLVTRVTADPSRPGGDTVSATLARPEFARFPWKLAAFSVHWVLALPLAVPWAIARWRQMRMNPLVWATVLLGAFLLLGGSDPPMTIPMAPVALLGMAVLADVLSDAVRQRDRDQLLLVAWLLLALPTLGYGHLPAKYLVPSAPAVALLVARLFRRKDGRLLPGVAWAVVAAGALLGVLITLADAEYTNVGRMVARDVIAPGVRAGNRVWYGGQWGSQWYAMQAGAIMLASTEPFPTTGDFIVASRNAGVTSTPSLDSLSSRRFFSRFGRVMSPEDGAGFYSNWYGYLPWTWHNGVIENVTLWRVRGTLKGQGPAAEGPSRSADPPGR